MKITFLGTGTSQGIPVIACQCEVCSSLDYRDKRLRVSVLIEIEHNTWIIDIGPDFRQQMLSNRVQKLDAVLLTHEHRDHTAGLDEVRSFNFKHDMDMPVYGEHRVLNQLQQDFNYIFSDIQYPGLPRILLHEISENKFYINQVEITPIRVMHYKLPVFGFRIGNFAYITDANSISEEETQKLYGLEILVLNALQIEPHISHFTLQEAIDIAQKLKPQKTYFTHISHHLGLHQTISNALPENMELSFDGLTVYCS